MCSSVLYIYCCDSPWPAPSLVTSSLVAIVSDCSDCKRERANVHVLYQFIDVLLLLLELGADSLEPVSV